MNKDVDSGLSQNCLFDEQQVILRCQKGDKQSYGLIVQKYMKRAYFTALGLTGSSDAALDLSQDAFVRAYRAIHRIDASKKFFTWYYQILRNLCFNFLRDQARRARNFSNVDEKVLNNFIDETADTTTLLEKEEIRTAIWKALAQLENQDREIIILKDIQDNSYKEIAEILSCPIGTVMSRLYNARIALKAQLQRFYYE